jgi:hypothetical protein
MKIKLIDSSDVEIDVLQKHNEYKNLRFKNNLYFNAEASLLNIGTLKLDQENKIVFTNCIFEDGIHFQIEIANAIDSDIRIIFKDCVIKEYFDTSSAKYYVVNNDADLKLSIEFYRCVLPAFEFEDSIFEYIFCSNCICWASQRSMISFNNCEIQNYHFQNILGRIFINDQGKSSVQIRYSDDNLNIERSVFNDFISDLIKTLTPTKIFQLETKYVLNDCKEIYFEGIKSDKEVKEIDFRKKVHLHLTNDELRLLNISLSISDKEMVLKKITITGAWLNELNLNNISNGKCKFEKIKVNKVYIHNYTNPDTTFYDIQSNGEVSLLEIRDSTLADCTVDKVKFGRFEKVSFYRTSLEKTRFSAVTFPKEIEALSDINYPLEKSIDYQIEQYETYRQLSNALSSQGNQVIALEMYKKMYESLRKSKTLDWQDKFILCLNNLSNEHGTSIKRSFWLFLGIGTLLLILFINTTPNRMYNWGWVDLCSFIDAFNMKVFFVLADPTHKISTLEELAGGQLSSFNYFISFLSRILMAWIYYQFISAFRKFGKKTSS